MKVIIDGVEYSPTKKTITVTIPMPNRVDGSYDYTVLHFDERKSAADTETIIREAMK